MDLPEALSLVNKPVRELAAYHLVSETVPIKLNQNENPWDWPPEIKEEIARFVRERPLNRYPPFIPDELRAALGAWVGVPGGSVIAGNGSNEMILVLLMALAGQATPLVLCQPTFTVYSLVAQGLNAPVKTVFARPDLSPDVDAIIACIRENPRSVLLLCSPNNPTGFALPESDIRRILGAHTGFCILDQAYVEFGGFSAIPLVSQYPNLIVTRTFSKAFGAAGLRLGYMVGAEPVIAQIGKVKLPYNINFFSEYVARVLMSHPDTVRRRVNELIVLRDDLYAFLGTLPFDAVYPSRANFIMVRHRAKDRLFEHLKGDGILVRDVSRYPMLQDCLRISVGSPEENAALKKSLAAFFKT